MAAAKRSRGNRRRATVCSWQCVRYDRVSCRILGRVRTMGLLLSGSSEVNTVPVTVPVRRRTEVTMDKVGVPSVPSPATRWVSSRRRTAGIVAFVTWLFAVLTITSALMPQQRYRIHEVTRIIPAPATAIATAVSLVLGVVLLQVARGLRRRKRRAWRIAVTVTAALAASHLVKGLDLGEVIISLAILTMLVTSRREFYALGDPVTRWYTVRVLVELLVLDVVLGMAMLLLNPHRVSDHPSLGAQFRQVVFGLVGVSGPVRFHSDRFQDLFTATLLGLGFLTLLVTAYMIL
ncbi:MAG: hypothetical protein HYR62_02340 [Actinobacteria bacterium]|nr:hypothetical protein [Actinomycetota bacterium]